MTRKFSHVHLVPISLVAVAGFIIASTFAVNHNKTANLSEVGSALTTQTLKFKTDRSGLASISLNDQANNINTKPGIAEPLDGAVLAVNSEANQVLSTQAEAAINSVK